MDLGHSNNSKDPYKKKRHVIKVIGSYSSKLDREMPLLRFGFWPEIDIWKFLLNPPAENQLAPVSLNYFHISPLNYLNLVLIPGAKLDGHRALRQGVVKTRQAESVELVFTEPDLVLHISWKFCDIPEII